MTQLSLDDLMRIEVVSASKKTQNLTDVAASVFVITAEDIRRAGARSIPEALRLAPGVEVGRDNANTWSVGIRGFNGRFSNKLLVLVDGRSVYTPLFSGTYWDLVQIPFTEIDRIEVVRGPGGAVWGANAVNGVINIVTRKAEEPEGTSLVLGGGTLERAFATLTHGEKFGANGAYRISVRGYETGPTSLPDGTDAQDGIRSQQSSFRADWQPSKSDAFTFTAGTIRNDWTQRLVTPLLAPPFSAATVSQQTGSQWYALGRWERNGSPSTQTSAQAYIESYYRPSPEVTERRRTFELELERRDESRPGHGWLFGVNYRNTWDDTQGTDVVQLNPASHTDQLFSGFVADDIRLNSRTRLTVGAKVEHNGYTGWEFQPSLRALHRPNDRDTLWAAVSKAVRTPSRMDRHGRVNYRAFPGQGGLPTLISLFGSEGFTTEKLIANEVGWRSRLAENANLDVSAFYNVYSDLRTFEPRAGYLEGTPPHGVAPFTFSNKLRGETFGAEVVTRLRPSASWNLMLGYSFLESNLRLDASSADPFGPNEGDGRGSSPRHQLTLQSQLSLGHGFELDGALYYVDSFREVGKIVPGYTRLDLRLGWRPCASMEASLSLQNLLQKRHAETDASLFGGSYQIPRSAILQVTWRF